MEERNRYITGSAVRELEPAPARRERRDPREEEAERKRRARRNAARRNRQRTLYMSKGYVVFLTLCVAIGAFFAVSYVKLQADITYRMKHIASIESQISDLKADNDANYKRIMTSVDLNEIKSTAINELGMAYATEEQVVYYTVESSNFIDQYVDIPVK
ncbi:MAG: hypothetical protein PUF45_08820 [Lachnospiraceae bacterium]|nr:hypothetical protein [Lachnospiraceae bacterium]